MTSVDGAAPSCPLCDYSLRGLDEPRCPECGFRFTWAELAARRQTDWLFESARRRRFAAVWRTWARTCRPRRFWRDLSPAAPVRAGRLVLYWVLATAVLVFLPTLVVAPGAFRYWRGNQAWRALFQPLPGQPGLVSALSGGYGSSRVIRPVSDLDYIYPQPSTVAFWRQAWDERRWWRDPVTNFFPAVVAVVVAWPWASLAALLLYAASMRRAKVNRRHVLRVAIYGCDFALLLAATMAAATWWVWREGVANAYALDRWLIESPTHGAVPLTLTVGLCAAVATYRLSLAYARYLRFDRPVLTVVAAQLMVVLLAGVVLVATGQLFPVE